MAALGSSGLLVSVFSTHLWASEAAADAVTPTFFEALVALWWSCYPTQSAIALPVITATEH